MKPNTQTDVKQRRYHSNVQIIVNGITTHHRFILLSDRKFSTIELENILAAEVLRVAASLENQ